MKINIIMLSALGSSRISALLRRMRRVVVGGHVAKPQPPLLLHCCNELVFLLNVYCYVAIREGKVTVTLLLKLQFSFLSASV